MIGGELADIVITGAGLVTPLGATRDETWSAVSAGRCGMGPMSAMESPLPSGAQGGQAVDLPADFEPALPREARYLRFALLQAVREAGVIEAERDLLYPIARRAVVLGTTLHGMRAGGEFLRTNDLGTLRTFLAGDTLDLAIRGLALAGISATTCSACSSSLGSIALGITLLQSGKCDLVVAGGYDTISEYVFGGFNSLRLVAEGALRPFSRERRGMKLAEGYGIVVLERASEAARRKATVFARIAGWGESADAHHLTQPHPRGEGASRAIRQALARSDVGVAGIHLIAAHATGTNDNDAAEHAALADAFGEHLREVPVVAFKSHLGHTLGGAGAVELILSMCALRDQVVPPCATVSEDEVAFDGLKLATTAPRPAEIGATLNTSLGFGGANTSVVLTRPREISAAMIQPAVRLRDVYVTGVGVVTPGIIGNDAFRQRLTSAIAPTWSQPRLAFNDVELEGLLSARRVRRMSDYVKLQLAAATVACRDAKIDDLAAFAARCSAILGTMHGSATFCAAAYYGQIVREGILAANPSLFAEGVPNAAAAQLSLMIGLKGGCQTIIGTRTSGLDALGLGAARIATGACDRVIVGAGEEYFDVIEQAYRHCGLAAPEGAGGGPFDAESRGFNYGGGAVAMVLECEASLRERGREPIARIASTFGAKPRRDEIPATLAHVLSRCKADAIVSSACSTWIDRAEALAVRQARTNIAVTSIYGYVPETLSATPMFGLVAALLCERLPAPLAGGGGVGSLQALNPATGVEQPRRIVMLATGVEQPRRIAVLATDFTGCVACATVERL